MTNSDPTFNKIAAVFIYPGGLFRGGEKHLQYVNSQGLDD